MNTEPSLPITPCTVTAGSAPRVLAVSFSPTTTRLFWNCKIEIWLKWNEENNTSIMACLSDVLPTRPSPTIIRRDRRSGPPFRWLIIARSLSWRPSTYDVWGTMATEDRSLTHSQHTLFGYNKLHWVPLCDMGLKWCHGLRRQLGFTFFKLFRIDAGNSSLSCIPKVIACMKVRMVIYRPRVRINILSQTQSSTNTPSVLVVLFLPN